MDSQNQLKTSELDSDGFLSNPSLWSEKIAIQIAEQDGICKLNDAQWLLINSLRKYYFSHRTTPPLRRICHINNMQNNCVAVNFDNQGIELWKIAGLPNPGEEAKAYM